MKTFVFCFLLILLSSCLRTQRDIMLEEEVKRLQGQQAVIKSEHTQKEKFLRKSAIEKDQAIEDLRIELQLLAGKINALDFESKRYFNEKFLVHENSLKSLKDELDKLKEETRNLRAAKVPVQQTNQDLTGGLNMKDLYNSAYKYYTEKKYALAVEDLSQLIKKFPNTHYLENAYYFMAFSQRFQNKFEEAILSFEEFIKRFPKSKRLPEVIYMQGHCFLRINSIEDAKYSFMQIIDKHPNSPHANLAKAELSKLNKTGKK